MRQLPSAHDKIRQEFLFNVLFLIFESKMLRRSVFLQLVKKE